MQPEFFRLRGERLADRFQCKLAGGVRRLERQGDLTKNTGQKDQTTVALAAEACDQWLSNAQRTKRIYLEQAAELGQRYRFNWPVGCHAGITDQRIKLACISDHGLDRMGIGDVEPEGGG